MFDIGFLFGIILSLGLFIWGLFMPRVAGYTYIILYSLLLGYAFITDRIKPNVDPKKWLPEEIEIIKKYYWALRFSFGAKSLSLLLNSLRFASILLVILYLLKQMWVFALFLGLFFIIVFFITTPLIIRLDPFFCLMHKARKGDMYAEYELSLLKNIYEKYIQKNIIS
ncbi:MAG: hypothetical protein A2Y66_07440 [Nitrospirae bacterium RBG_13_41_22]|nr:MAG: hypothetical protein A2Y66_07440 [Nitrospirae bacterium RBG_13_41_22]